MIVRQTSIGVYRRIEADGLLSAARWEVYRQLYQHGPATAAGRLTQLHWLEDVPKEKRR